AAGEARPVGRLVMKIVIAADGSVTSVRDDGSDLANHDATTCMVHATEKLTFPQPEGGATTVRVPVVFAH
ncbi:MAG TPA: AgmX/PglI C-terminal domain-containing protein, partial [Polyangiaceae bacterium]